MREGKKKQDEVRKQTKEGILDGQISSSHVH